MCRQYCRREQENTLYMYMYSVYTMYIIQSMARFTRLTRALTFPTSFSRSIKLESSSQAPRLAPPSTPGGGGGAGGAEIKVLRSTVVMSDKNDIHHKLICVCYKLSIVIYYYVYMYMYLHIHGTCTCTCVHCKY